MKKRIIIIVSIVLAVAIAASAAVIAVKVFGKSDVQKLNEKYIEYLTKGRLPNENEYPIQHSDKGNYFEDLDYTDASTGAWILEHHLYRLNTMTLGDREKLQNDEAYRKTVIGVLDYWLNNDFQNENWWYNEIDVPMLLAKSIFMLKPYLTEDQLAKTEEILLRGSLKGNERIKDWTGANLMWGVFNTVNHALLYDDEEYLKKAVERAGEEIVIQEGTAEGIKADYTFYQHGAQNYIYGYGRSFIGDVANLMYLFSDTKYMFPEEKVKIFEGLVLDGARSLQYKGYADYQTAGREFARQGYLGSGSLTAALQAMRDTKECTRKEEINAFLNEIAGKSSHKINKSFPNSYTVVSSTANSYMSCKGVHTDFVCSEASSNENFMAYNFFDGGTLCFMHDGKEYYGLSPLMDYSLVPGVTAYAEDDKTLLNKMGNNESWVANPGKTDICSLFTEGGISGIGMEINREETLFALRGYTSRIFGNGYAVIAGSGIYALDFEKDVRTCINQTMYLGGDLKPGESKVLKKGESITMGGFVYTNLCDTGLVVSVEHVTGDWKRNNLDQKGDTAASGDVVKIYYDHGIAPEIASYAVSVCEVEAKGTQKTAAVLEEESQTLTIGDKEVVFDYSGGNCEIYM